MSRQSPVIRILALLKTKKKEAAILLGLVIAAAAFDISVPFISQRLIDTLIDFFRTGGQAPVVMLLLAAAGILFATVLNRIMKSVYDYRLFLTVTKLEDAVRFKAFGKYLDLHALFHHGSSSGQIIGRIERGATSVFVVLFDILGQNLIPPLIIFTGVFASLPFKKPRIALPVLLPFPAYIFLVRVLSRKIYEVEKIVNEEFENLSKESYDVASNVLTVKKFSQEQAETKHQIGLMAHAREIQYKGERLWAVVENTQTLVSTVGRITVILLGGWFVLEGRSTIGEFVLYITLQNMAYAPLWQLSIIFPRLRRNISRAERLFALMDEEPKVTDKPDAVELAPLKNALEFKDVHFRYAPGKSWAVRGVNLVVPAHTTVALVGRSGSGKTTFVNLLLRSYHPNRGAILIDGTDIRDVTQDSLRRQIAVVPQEVDLFSRSIAENIAYGRPGTKRPEIVRAAKIALADGFISRADKGYDTLVGERGLKLSGGERQRIGIARAFLRDPRILILDEATSHLDTESEKLIQRATAALMKDRTTFIIAHRLSTIVNADLILVFDHGRIEAAGTHRELLKKSPTYERLHSLQFEEPEEMRSIPKRRKKLELSLPATAA